jgi:hypothetical protein
MAHNTNIIVQFLSNLPMVAKAEDISNHYTFTSQAPLNNISNSISFLGLKILKISKLDRYQSWNL